MTDFLELRALSASERSVLYDGRVLAALDQYLVACNLHWDLETKEGTAHIGILRDQSIGTAHDPLKFFL